MPIDSVNEQYSANQYKWQRCRDANEGSDAVKGRTSVYLPKLSGQKDDQYKAYLLRALFFGATQRTVEGTTGAIMRKPPTYDLPPRLDYLQDNATSTGIAMTEFAKQIIKELFITGRIGVLVDRSKEEGGQLYWALYSAEAIINWREENGVLVLVVLEEDYEAPGSDKYETKIEKQYRELFLEDGVYKQRVHRKQDGKDAFLTEEYIPTRRGKPMSAIPFVFGSPSGASSGIAKPPILDLVDVNLSHYRSSADLEHGRHFTALPTIYCTGVKAKDLGDGIHIGSGQALILPPPEAKAGIIEFTGQGLGALKEAIEEKEGQMAKLGARMLAQRTKGVESSETARINASSEESVTISIANSGSAILNKALKISAEWEEAAGEFKITLNTDILDAKMDPHSLTALLAVRQAGEISAEAFTHNLQKGELLLPADDVDTERGRLELEGPGEGEI